MLIRSFRSLDWGKLEQQLDRRKKVFIVVLILISGFFCLQANSYSERYYSYRKIDSQNYSEAAQSSDGISVSIETEKKKELFGNLAGNIGKSDDLSCEENNLEREISEIVEDYPVEKMVQYIAERDRNIAAFLIGIAKKESNWGQYSPSKNGRDCYNYWGLKGRGENGSVGSYACFGNPEEAVNKVADKIESLVNRNIDTPSEFVVWKCGSSCAGHDPGSVRKWVADVGQYYNQIAFVE